MRKFIGGFLICVAFLGTSDFAGMDFWPRMLIGTCLVGAYNILYDRIGEKV